MRSNVKRPILLALCVVSIMLVAGCASETPASTPGASAEAPASATTAPPAATAAVTSSPSIATPSSPTKAPEGPSGAASDAPKIETMNVTLRSSGCASEWQWNYCHIYQIQATGMSSNCCAVEYTSAKGVTATLPHRDMGLVGHSGKLTLWFNGSLETAAPDAIASVTFKERDGGKVLLKADVPTYEVPPQLTMSAAAPVAAPCADGTEGCKKLVITFQNEHAKASVHPSQISGRTADGEPRSLLITKEDAAKTVGPKSTGTLSFLLPPDSTLARVVFDRDLLFADVPAA